MLKRMKCVGTLIASIVLLSMAASPSSVLAVGGGGPGDETDGDNDDGNHNNVPEAVSTLQILGISLLTLELARRRMKAHSFQKQSA